nr:transposase [uncultured Flavobacterium sp.]
MKNRKRNRMLGYDYSQNNLYFVTICVQDRKCCFGNVIDTVGTGRDLSVLSVHEPMNPYMELNEYGSIAQKQLSWLNNQYAYVVLYSFIVMPNHVHAILEIDSNLVTDSEIKIKSLSELIGAYKTTTSKQIHLAGFTGFTWQRSFHDHIIRNDGSYERISSYIETNHERWNTDVFFEK